MEAKESNGEKPQQPTSTTNGSNLDGAETGKIIWPTTTDLNTRIRKLITAFQRNFKKEEIKNVQKAKVCVKAYDKKSTRIFR